MSDEEQIYQWYLAGYDFLVDRWNEMIRDAQDIGEMYRIIDRNIQDRKAAWELRCRRILTNSKPETSGLGPLSPSVRS
jgi:hypothetical protein